MKGKRMLVISDLHCGHMSGLRVDDDFKPWVEFKKQIDRLKPFDICVANGDLIDGKGEKTGGTELITTDRAEQKNMAIEVLDFIGAKEYVFTYGTPYHVGREEDWEGLVAEKFGGDISGQRYIDVNGLCFHFKHKIASSTIPHGRFTALARQKMWNLFWNEFNEAPKVDVFVRSHVHYYDYCGGYNWLALITPALLGWGSKYGERMCEGTINFGFVVFDVESKSKWTWNSVISTSLYQANLRKL
jgi:hypothetical protein